MPFAKRVVVEEFPDRVLWGTDWPHPNLKDHMPDDGLLVDFIPHIAVTTPELQQQTLGGQPHALVLARRGVMRGRVGARGYPFECPASAFKQRHPSLPGQNLITIGRVFPWRPRWL